MTHGGLMGTTEALSIGVPMIGIPIFADQGPNIRQYEELGVAIELNHKRITKDNVLAAIHEITSSNKYGPVLDEFSVVFIVRLLFRIVFWYWCNARNKSPQLVVLTLKLNSHFKILLVGLMN